MTEIRILFDFDDVLNDLSRCWVKELNRIHNLNVAYEDVVDYDIRKAFPMLTEKEIYTPYLDGTLYLDIAPDPEMQELIRELSIEHEIYIVTANAIGINSSVLLEHLYGGWKEKAFDYLIQFVNEYYPEIPVRNIIITPQKHLLRADLLVDDNPQYLIGCRYAKLLLDKRYNSNFDTERHGITRVYSASDIKRYIEEELI